MPTTFGGEPKNENFEGSILQCPRLNNFI
ncbi:hypothetical protein ACRCIX_12860 [Staphylococcus aureus]